MCPRLFDWRWRLVLSGEEETRICRIKSRMRMKSSSGVVRYGGINLRQRRNTGCLAETRYRFLYLFVYDEPFLQLYTMDITSIEMYITEMCIAYFFFFFNKRKSRCYLSYRVCIRYSLATGRLRLNYTSVSI